MLRFTHSVGIQRRRRETGSFNINNSSNGTHRTVRTPELKGAVLNIIEEHSEISIRKIAGMDNVYHLVL